jgi:hypothetical protein
MLEFVCRDLLQENDTGSGSAVNRFVGKILTNPDPHVIPRF